MSTILSIASPRLLMQEGAAATPLIAQNEPKRSTVPAHPRRSHSRWLSDSDIHDDAVRRFLRRYTTPRHGSNGQVCWPIDEVDGDE